MPTFEDIKFSINKKVEELITLHFNNYIETSRLSTIVIGKEIGKIINEEMTHFKKSTKTEKVKVKIVKENINADDKILESKSYKIYMKTMIEKLKNEDKDKKNKRNILELFEESYNKWKNEEKK
jgi:apolipoprotein N-acyltransferase